MFITILTIGMILNFIGAVLMFVGHSKIEVSIGQLSDGKYLRGMSKSKFRTLLFRWGMAILSFGFFIQIGTVIIARPPTANIKPVKPMHSNAEKGSTSRYYNKFLDTGYKQIQD